MQVGIHFSHLNGIGINVVHHLPHIDEGSALRIKDISVSGTDTYGIGEYNLATSFDRPLFQLCLILGISP